MPDALWGGLSAFNAIGVIVTQGAALGWYDAGPLALKIAMSFSGIPGRFTPNLIRPFHIERNRRQVMPFGKRVEGG